jgi:hypothetical protein
MWGILTSPLHAQSFEEHGEDYAPMRALVERLSERPYAGELFAFKSLATFILTTAPTYAAKSGHDCISIDYDPTRKQFILKYEEWVSETSNPPHRVASRRICAGVEVHDVIDSYVIRLQRSRPS